MGSSKIAAAAFITLAATAAHAQEWYAGFGIGSGSLDGRNVRVVGTTTLADSVLTSFSFSPVSGDDTIGTARLGARFGRFFAVEAAYFHLGEYDFATGTLGATPSVVLLPARLRSAGLSVVGILPLQAVDLYGRVGYARTELKADETIDATRITVKERFNEAVYGAGARWNMTPQLGLFAEYQRHGKLDFDGWLAGFEWKF